MKFMQLAIAEAKRAGDRGDYPIGAVITRLMGNREVVIASAGNRVKTSGSSIKHVELETLKYVSSGYGRYLPDFVLYSTHEPCAMCAGACVWSRIGAVVYGVSQEERISQRVPTICFNLPNVSPAGIAEELAKQNIGVRDGHMYSPRLMRRLGLTLESGAVRASLVHYNTVQEVRRFGNVLAEMKASC